MISFTVTNPAWVLWHLLKQKPSVSLAGVELKHQPELPSASLLQQNPTETYRTLFIRWHTKYCLKLRFRRNFLAKPHPFFSQHSPELFLFTLSLLVFCLLLCLLCLITISQQPLLAFSYLITTHPYESIADWSPAVSLLERTDVTHSNRHAMDRVLALKLSSIYPQDPVFLSPNNFPFFALLGLSRDVLLFNIYP